MPEKGLSFNRKRPERYCSKCGAENTEDQKVCSACSWVLTSQSTQPAADAKTSGLAITAFVLGVSSFLCAILTTVPAIIFGIVSLVKINKSNGRLKGKGFAIAGIAVSGVMLVVFVIAMLAAILMPTIGCPKVPAKRIVCGTNMRGLVNAMAIYSNDYDDKLPTADSGVIC